MTDEQIMELIIASKQAEQQLRDDQLAWQQLDRVTRQPGPCIGQQTCKRKADRLEAAIKPLLRAKEQAA